MKGELRYSVARTAGWQPGDGGEPISSSLLLVESLWWLWWKIVCWTDSLPALTHEDALSIREHLRWFFHPETEEDGCQ